jgi:hypothetical protein
MGEVTKTLELQLFEPNSHKQRKLRRTQNAYQQALQEAVAAGCDTQSAANDVVGEYDLSGDLTNALERYTSHNSVGTATTPTSFTTTTRCGSPTEDYNSTTSHRTRSSSTSKSRTTKITTSGFQHAPIPTSGSGSKRCAQTTPKRVNYPTLLRSGGTAPLAR